MLFDGLNSRAYQVLDLGAGLKNRFPVAADMAFDPTQEHLYVLTGPRVSYHTLQLIARLANVIEGKVFMVKLSMTVLRVIACILQLKNAGRWFCVLVDFEILNKFS